MAPDKPYTGLNRRQRSLLKQAGDQLAARRREAGLSCRQLGDAAKVSYSALSDIERGNRWIKQQEGIRMMHALKMTAEDFNKMLGYQCVPVPEGQESAPTEREQVALRLMESEISKPPVLTKPTGLPPLQNKADILILDEPDKDAELAEDLYSWLQKQGKSRFFMTDVYQRGPQALRAASTARRIVDKLADTGKVVRIDSMNFSLKPIENPQPAPPQLQEAPPPLPVFDMNQFISAYQGMQKNLLEFAGFVREHAKVLEVPMPAGGSALEHAKLVMRAYASQCHDFAERVDFLSTAMKERERQAAGLDTLKALRDLIDTDIKKLEGG